jgi:hypothetical protein
MLDCYISLMNIIMTEEEEEEEKKRTVARLE